MNYQIGDIVNGWELLQILPRYNLWGKKIRDYSGIQPDDIVIRECFYHGEVPFTSKDY